MKNIKKVLGLLNPFSVQETKLSGLRLKFLYVAYLESTWGNCVGIKVNTQLLLSYKGKG